MEPPRSEPPTPSLARDPRPTTEPDSGAETAAEPAATEEPQSDSAAASEAKETKDTPANRDEDRPYRPGGLYPMGGEGGYTRPRLKFITNENLGWGRIHLPEIELQTTAAWLTLDPAQVTTGPGGTWRRNELDIGLVGAGRALQAVAIFLLMVDPRDLGLVAPGPLAARGAADDLPV